MPVVPGTQLGHGSTDGTSSTGLARLAGSSRYETGVAVSRRAFADGSRVVYLARGDRLGDVLAGGSLTDGPVLMTLPNGDVPKVVLDEVRRLGAAQVVAIGGTTAVPDATLRTAAQGRPTLRLAGSDDFGTAVAVAKRAFPRGASEVYLFGPGGSPDAVAGGSLTKGPVLQVPATGAAPALVRQAISELRPSRVVAPRR